MVSLPMQAVRAACEITHTNPMEGKASVVPVPYQYGRHEYVVTVVGIDRTAITVHVAIPLSSLPVCTVLSECPLPD